MAKKFNIPIIRPNWIYDSASQNKLLVYDDYRLKCFEGVSINLIGFDQTEEAGIKNFIKNNNGIILTNNFNDLNDSDVILINHCKFLSLNEAELGLIYQFNNKIVIEQWVSECLEKNEFITNDQNICQIIY